ncbi:hypothetical protein PC116_g998 [Phytophthora cactorum]|uniref:BED-type domain-containing protein n=1 Tax=Phytophthora cactorum TaxID=29920 RepID=A0A329SK01_9STRA|nr:hypothetical protein Pcac1_g3005 [Phytophthora cactorum]KAG2953862.1 hypothetical protein PC117_g1677 [Phytophthora cactorum]KAG3035089.1 hypothetical protein PC120_g1016 [Phytophthora cactorum]KAG3100068.1 hypothetical protein PC121_g1794 [Phytophthora cactorum]KAG4251253.1 hypothetical protein PC116_g998 [Phytophthora cactorum]
MGRKPSNVYDYFTRLEPEFGRKGLVRYQCKKCDKQYASNATRLADHLKMSCVPGFQTNQRSRKIIVATHSAPATNSHHEAEAEDEGETEEAEDSTDSMAATVASLAVPAPSPDTYSAAGVDTTQSLALKRADQQLLTNMLESEAEPPQDQTEVLLRLAKLSTCVIGDAMALMKVKGHLVDLNLVRGYDAPLAMNICGPALTVKMMPITGATVGSGSYDYMDTAEMGQVVVISAPTGISTAVFGGILATASKARNVAGVVTDGRVRDVQELCAMNFPAFATGTSVHGVWGSTAIGDVNCPIVVAGCVVRHNDIIRGDINGVIVIPAERAQDIATRAEIIEDQDNKIADALNEGEPLQRSLHRFRSSRDV